MALLGFSSVLALLASAQMGIVGGVEAQSSLDDLVKPGLPAQLIGAFREVCFNNRGSWNAMKQNAERSSLGFKRVAGKGHQQVDYLAFPLAISLKRWGQRGYLCLAQTAVEERVTANDLTEGLARSGPGFEGVVFRPGEDGLKATLPDSGRISPVGMQFTNVRVRVSKDSSQPFPIAQLLIYAN